MSFLASTVDWFLDKRSSHMGPEQYVSHNGMRDGRSTSGALLWAIAEEERHLAKGNMINAETHLLQKVAEEIAEYVPMGTATIDLGPGTVVAFKNKTLPIIEKLKTKRCVFVDESIAFLKQIIATTELKKNLEIKPIVDNFFENEAAYCDEPALVCSFGGTVSNIINPVSNTPPQVALIDGLSKLAHAANAGWMLVGFDSDQDGERTKQYFKKHDLFQLNVFDRMEVELPIRGDFSAKAFSYEPEWIATSGQLAHIANVERDMDFCIGTTPIYLKKGRRLHIKNSYKFTPAFFETCCKQAGLDILKLWSDNSCAKVYLLKISSKQNTYRQALVS